MKILVSKIKESNFLHDMLFSFLIFKSYQAETSDGFLIMSCDVLLQVSVEATTVGRSMVF